MNKKAFFTYFFTQFSPKAISLSAFCMGHANTADVYRNYFVWAMQTRLMCTVTILYGPCKHG